MNPNSTDDFKAAAELEQVGDKCCEAMILPYGENPSPDVIFRKGQEIA
jgi:hypothetical protein